MQPSFDRVPLVRSINSHQHICNYRCYRSDLSSGLSIFLKIIKTKNTEDTEKTKNLSMHSVFSVPSVVKIFRG